MDVSRFQFSLIVRLILCINSILYSSLDVLSAWFLVGAKQYAE